jgi:1-acyl-sn-glycerol-3-phosphate acyltransferase
MQWLRSVIFTAFMFVWTLAYSIFFVLVSWAVPLPQRHMLARWYGARTLNALRVLCKLDFVVEGLENLPSQPHIAYWKHSSSWEVFAQFLIGPPKVIVVKRELIYVPFFGWGLMLLRSIAVARGAGASAVNQVVAQGRARLNEGLSVLIFPEGTRMAAGQTRRYGVSGALLASLCGCKVVPVAHDAGYYWPRRGLMKHPGTIRVIIEPPIDATGREPRDINEQAQAGVEAAVERIRKEKTGLITPASATGQSRG